MHLGDLVYELPSELIAQRPLAERTAARLLVLAADGFHHSMVSALPGFLAPGDLLVLNDTRVIPARVHGRRPSGGRIEVLLYEPVGEDRWAVLARGGPRPGERVHFPAGEGEWIEDRGEGRWILRLEVGRPVLEWLHAVGELPLPPYVRRPTGPTPEDRLRYQTTFARVPGAVAAPTAGLHFTDALFRELAAHGIAWTFVTLHVGPGTFLPIRGDDVSRYRMAGERFVIGSEAAATLEEAMGAGRRVIAVGTTVVRALESAAAEGGLGPRAGVAELFIAPGHRFRVVRGLLTNFHLPRTPLLALVAAFAGWERIRAAYEEAVRRRYRFYSYGDAMLLL
jgi:S-adenosylmethionine:tRNA ribosyltransferase-isomerase